VTYRNIMFTLAGRLGTSPAPGYLEFLNQHGYLGAEHPSNSVGWFGTINPAFGRPDLPP